MPLQSVRATEWRRPENQLVYRRSLVWGGYRNWDGDEFHTDVPVFDVKTWHRVAYVKPADPEDEFDRDTIGYVSDDIASAVCGRILKIHRAIGDPWDLPNPVEYDPDDRLVAVRGVRFAQADVKSEREILAMAEQELVGWGLGEIRQQLERSR